MGQPLRKPRRDPAAVARYIMTMSAELSTMARDGGLDTLGYLLELARLEAQTVLGPSREAE